MTLKIDGLSVEEFQSLSDEEMITLIFCDRPVAFKVGSAEILGQFRKSMNGFEVELAHIEGGGEGVLPLIWKIATDYARSKGFTEIDWYVHAVSCANPNPKLHRVLTRKMFRIVEKDGIKVFHLNYQLAEQDTSRNPHDPGS